MDQAQDDFISRPEFQSGRDAIFLAVDRDDSVGLTSDELRLTTAVFSKVAAPMAPLMSESCFDPVRHPSQMTDANEDRKLSYAATIWHSLHIVFRERFVSCNLE
jgi:hypothetical protein